MKKNQIILGDSIKEMKKIKDQSVDLIFADPPYNLQLKDTLYRPDQTTVEAVTQDWDKFNTYQEYDNFTNKWLKECQRILKKGGALWVIGSYHNILRVGSSIQDKGLWILKTSNNKTFITPNIIIAGGVGSFEPRKLPLKELTKFEGKSVFYSVNDLSLIHI